MKRRALIALIFLLSASCFRSEKVTEVIDGDTFKTASGRTVRLLGINAPEINEPGADIAKAGLRLMILGKAVVLKKGVRDQDDYGRSLRYVYVNDTFINAELVALGYVETRFYPPDTLFRQELEKLEQQAIRNKRGLWAFNVFQVPDTTGTPAQSEASIAVDTSAIISWRDAAQYYGETKIVEGVIVASNNTGKVCFLNFHKDWKKYFTAVIFSSDFDKFPARPEDHYLNHKVRVKGIVKEYNGKPEIILKGPAQIDIID
jgi:micrococcal nuclease